MAVSTAVIAAGSAFQSYKQGKKANAAAKEQERLQRASANSKELTETRAALRKSRIARARALQTAEFTGGTGSSGVTGQVSDIGTQTASIFSDISNTANIANARLDQQAKIRDAKIRQGNWGALQSVAMAGMSAYGGIKGAQSQLGFGKGAATGNQVAKINAGHFDPTIGPPQ